MVRGRRRTFSLSQAGMADGWQMAERMAGTKYVSTSTKYMGGLEYTGWCRNDARHLGGLS